MSLEKAKAHLHKYNMEDRVMEFPVSSATVKEAAEALGCEEAEIAKTMSFLVGEQPILIVTAGDQKIDNAKFKAYFHMKAKMIPHDEVEPLIGHEVGGVCPFGTHTNVKVYLDVSMRRLATVYPACGSHNSAIGLSIEELEQASEYEKWIDVCKDVATS